MRISDWSSDVCSSDLLNEFQTGAFYLWIVFVEFFFPQIRQLAEIIDFLPQAINILRPHDVFLAEEGRLVLDDDARRLRQAQHRPVQNELLPGLERSEEHTSELQSLMRISYAVFCLKKQKPTRTLQNTRQSFQTSMTP